METPKLGTDVIVEKGDQILLIRRGTSPFEGELAFPGGHVDVGERVEEAALRELEEETGVEAELLTLLGVYSDPDRDPRYHIVTPVFIARWISGEPQGETDAAEAGWHDPREIDEMAFDHYKILQDYLQWREKGGTYWSGR